MYFAIAGSSGCGKSTIIKELIKENENLEFIPSYTSREPREGEIPGVTYTYITKEEFKEKIKEGEFIEFEQVHDNYYGNSKKVVQDALDRHKMIIKDVDVNGVKNLDVKLKEGGICPLVKVFFTVSKGTLKNRLIERGEKNLKLRLKRYKYEQLKSNMYMFDYIIVNENKDKDRTIDICKKIIEIGNNFDQIVPTKPIEKFSQKKFKNYFEKLKRGETLSPCKVTLVGDKIYLVDGHEKFVAGMVMGVTVSKKFVDKKDVKILSAEDYEKYLEYIKTPIINE